MSYQCARSFCDRKVVDGSVLCRFHDKLLNQEVNTARSLTADILTEAEELAGGRKWDIGVQDLARVKEIYLLISEFNDELRERDEIQDW